MPVLFNAGKLNVYRFVLNGGGAFPKLRTQPVDQFELRRGLRSNPLALRCICSGRHFGHDSRLRSAIGAGKATSCGTERRIAPQAKAATPPARDKLGKVNQLFQTLTVLAICLRCRPHLQVLERQSVVAAIRVPEFRAAPRTTRRRVYAFRRLRAPPPSSDGAGNAQEPLRLDDRDNGRSYCTRKCFRHLHVRDSVESASPELSRKLRKFHCWSVFSCRFPQI